MIIPVFRVKIQDRLRHRTGPPTRYSQRETLFMNLTCRTKTRQNIRNKISCFSDFVCEYVKIMTDLFKNLLLMDLKYVRLIHRDRDKRFFLQPYKRTIKRSYKVRLMLPSSDRGKMFRPCLYFFSEIGTLTESCRLFSEMVYRFLPFSSFSYGHCHCFFVFGLCQGKQV